MPPAGTQSPHPAPCQGWLHAEPPVTVLARARRLYLGAVSILPAGTSAIHRRGDRSRPGGTGGSERAEPKAPAGPSLRILPCVLGGPHRPEPRRAPLPRPRALPRPPRLLGALEQPGSVWVPSPIPRSPVLLSGTVTCLEADTGVPESRECRRAHGSTIEVVVGEGEWTPPGQPQFPQTLSRESYWHPW